MKTMAYEFVIGQIKCEKWQGETPKPAAREGVMVFSDGSAIFINEDNSVFEYLGGHEPA